MVQVTKPSAPLLQNLTCFLGVWLYRVDLPIDHPVGVGTDPKTGNIYVVDVPKLELFTAKGKSIRPIATTGFYQGQLDTPRGIFVDKNGRCVVADSGNDRIQVFSDRAYVGMYKKFEGGQMDRPTAVTLDHEGNLYVADEKRILIYGATFDFY